MIAFIYPGLNGLLKSSDRSRFLQVPQVRSRLTEVEGILSSKFGISIDFQKFLLAETSEVYQLDKVNIAATAICAIQVGVSEALVERLSIEPDWVMGCSLGDLGRSVFAGAYDFEAAISNHMHFTKNIAGIENIGKNIGLSTGATGAKFSPEDLSSIESLGVDISEMTPKFLNVGGRFSDLERVQELATLRGWSYRDILQYPAHCRHILPYVKAVADEFSTVHVGVPNIKMFSSFSNQHLSDPEQIKEEFLLSITKTIHWYKAVYSLVRNEGVTHFVNVGPCRSLLSMMRDLEITVDCKDAQDVLGI